MSPQNDDNILIGLFHMDNISKEQKVLGVRSETIVVVDEASSSCSVNIRNKMRCFLNVEVGPAQFSDICFV